MVAGAIAYHIAQACDTQHAKSGKMDDKKAKDFCFQQAQKYTQQVGACLKIADSQEFDNKGLDWLDQKMVQAAATALVQAQLAAQL